MRLLLFLGSFILFLPLLHAQNDTQDQNTNPLYWKHRKPHAAYWQQDVAYTIQARIDETTHIITAKEQLSYTNNSPDTLAFVYFHLYQNAFIKHAYTHNLEQANGIRPRLGSYETQGYGILIDNFTADGQKVKTELDNTILKVYLSRPLLPGRAVRFQMDFETFYDQGSTRRRMQMYDAWGFMHYNGCQWFPKISVYDAKFGWDTHQHLGKEFYGDFGSFDVTLDFASNYIVEATGALQNREEVLPEALRKQLDIKNFATKKWNEKPSVIIPYDKDQRKQWHYKAENVHDFAFTADPSYRIGTIYQDGVECVAIAQEPHASGWQNGAAIVARTIRTFSEDFGTYHYPKMVAADANDGMEYPMITMDGGRDPAYRGLLVHEIGHNWFYGMVGSNETYRAALDEGFTQFLTSEGLRKMDGDTFTEEKPQSKWKQHFAEQRMTRDVRVYGAYIFDAATGKDYQLNTHSDDFNGALGHDGGYRLVYYKTATMLYNLQYVLGDSLFQNAMKHYFNQWKFAHPYFEDFRNSIIQYTKADLNWFFDQWLETTKGLDYGISGIKKIKSTDSFEIKLARKGQMQMPIDFTVTTKKGNKQSYYIPNTWFEKATPATVLPRWIGWGKLDETYIARIAVPEGIQSVAIDTTQRLADRNMLDNSRSRGALIGTGKVLTRWDGGVNPVFDWKHYRLFVRPDLWYNALDGVKAGFHFEGSQMNTFYKMDGTVWFNTQLGRWDMFKYSYQPHRYSNYAALNYTFYFSTPVSRNLTALSLNANSRFLDGLWYHKLGLQWQISSKDELKLSAQTFYRNNGNSLNYLLYYYEWSSVYDRKNTSLNLSYTHAYNYSRGTGYFTLSARTPVLSDYFNYNYAQLEAINTHVLGRVMLRTRLFARYGLGDKMPKESSLFLAGASPEEMMENKYVRSMAFVPERWRSFSQYETNHFQYGGGLNMRGYAGYYAFDNRNGQELVGYKGRSGAAINVEADFSGYFRWQPALTRNWLSVNVYAFADAGIMELSTYSQTAPPDNWKFYYVVTPANKISDLRLDAGIGAAFTIKKWGVFEKAKPLTLRFDMPVFLNRAPYGAPQYLGARWLFGISRAF
jgi:hypothetical protein